jgi:cation transport ATPase
MRNIRENLILAFGYNVIGIPVAAMSLSSVSVIGNALRLRAARI